MSGCPLRGGSLTLGYPLTDEQTALGGVAHFADFEDKTSIWWTLVTGAHEVPESIGAAWKEIGAHLGNLGLPISAPEQPAPNSANITLLQKFQYGNVKLEGDLKAY
ncbi:LGFP repeat-containing protein [Rhodococcus zopfii]|uniref:LGFP repeat-containing protein n=1 Tax=Rhodococcus zopfii TaxID=43772 RepID=UPI0035565F53